ncbi:hypothetical protein AAMO2058_001280200 [Amorphochlora amoebiformis]
MINLVLVGGWERKGGGGEKVAGRPGDLGYPSPFFFSPGRRDIVVGHDIILVLRCVTVQIITFAEPRGVSFLLGFDSMKVKVLFFASCREIAGVDKLEMEVDNKTNVVGFMKTITKTYPKIENLLSNMVLSINLEYVSVNSKQALKEGDEIAFIPPVSGG